MRKLIFFFLCSCAAFASCGTDDPIGNPYPIKPDYALPQGNASELANDKIQAVFDKYGSYILYEFTQKDFEWTAASGTSASAQVIADKPDPDNVEAMVTFMEKAWLKFFPDKFLEGKGLPYRVMLADTIKQPRTPGSHSPSQRNPLYYAYRVTDMALAIGACYGKQSMDNATALAEKKKLQCIVWDYYLSKGIISLSPIYKEITALSDYSTTLTSSTSDEILYSRGFTALWTVSNSSSTFPVVSPVVFTIARTVWATTVPNMTPANDTKALLHFLLQHTSAEMEALYVDYPLLEPKCKLIQKYILEEYGIDIKAIGDATTGFN